MAAPSMRCWPTCRTASGVVRRNPDAKWLRREADIASFAAAQARILDALWQVVQPGGKLLYATCSVFRPKTGSRSNVFWRAGRRPVVAEEQLLPTAEHDGFSTACSKSVIDDLCRWLLALMLVPALAWAAEIEVANPQLLPGDDGYVLAADFKFELNPRLEEAVTKGVVLYFVADFELTKGRWYWLDEKLVTRTQTYRLSYHALTRQYRLSAGGLHQSFATLSEAVQVLSRLRNWVVAERGDKGLRAGEP
jgi:hypothetical protein